VLASASNRLKVEHDDAARCTVPVGLISDMLVTRTKEMTEESDKRLLRLLKEQEVPSVLGMVA
jgi:hypothetical protein